MRKKSVNLLIKKEQRVRHTPMMQITNVGSSISLNKVRVKFDHDSYGICQYHELLPRLTVGFALCRTRIVSKHFYCRLNFFTLIIVIVITSTNDVKNSLWTHKDIFFIL